ncbi:M16 family metallopeptidase [Thermodesulforhabdus norvegica]|uniref:Zinc protease n=1 Tax=Thermodesulforhabdus norvegica TaxID=39841 RepID=A0A1I4UBN8_9BACT|nr:pitrilysin family protein [Thermodesulforhabdus norvegica]SFM86397.1 zinc protease [Thermodesulforhabdus norvegica]
MPCKPSLKQLIATLLVYFLFLSSGFTNAKAEKGVDFVIPSKPGDTFVVLKNGLTLLISRDPLSPLVAIRIAVKTGSLYEPPLSGLSHYLEHVVAGGSTKRFSEKEAQELVKKLGGATNASTSYATTEYYITTLPEKWQTALDLMLSYLHDCLFDPREVEREKGVILREMQMGENNPERQLWYLFFRSAYRIHPVRNPVIGAKEVFEKLSRDDLIDYYRRWYVPSRMVISVVGPVQGDEVIRTVAQRTSNWETGAVSEPVLPDEPLPVREKRIVKTMNFVKQPRTMIGFPSVTVYDPRMYPLDVLAEILGGAKSGLLVRRLKDELNLVTDIIAFNWTPSFVRGQFIISFDRFSESRPEDVEMAVREVIEEVKADGVTKRELEAAKKRISARFVFERQTAMARAASLISSYIETGDPYFEESYVEKISQVSQKDVQSAAKKYLDWSRATVVSLEPPGLEVGKKPAVQGAPSSALHRPEIMTLENGLRVLIKSDRRSPALYIKLYGIGGQITDPPEKPGLAHFVGSLLTSGTRRYTREEIVQRIEALGGEISCGAGRNSYFLSIKLLRDDLPTGLKILKEILTSSTFPPEEIEKKRRETLTEIGRLKERWEQELLLELHGRFFSKHPYRFSQLGTLEAVKEFSREDVVDYYRRVIVPSDAVLAVYGDVDVDKLKRVLKKTLGKWNRKKEVSPLRVFPKEVDPAEPGKTFRILTEKSSAGLLIATSGLDIHSPLRPALDVLDAHLSGIQYPGGRLHEALRGGANNYVYVVHAFPFYGVKGGYFGIITQTAPEKVNRVLSIIFDELKRVMDRPLSSTELAEAKEMILTMKTFSLESIEAQASEEALNELLGLGRDYRARYEEKLKALSSEEVQKLARELFKRYIIIESLPEGHSEGAE